MNYEDPHVRISIVQSLSQGPNRGLIANLREGPRNYVLYLAVREQRHENRDRAPVFQVA